MKTLVLYFSSSLLFYYGCQQSPGKEGQIATITLQTIAPAPSDTIMHPDLVWGEYRIELIEENLSPWTQLNARVYENGWVLNQDTSTFKGSFVQSFACDLNHDGRPEIFHKYLHQGQLYLQAFSITERGLIPISKKISNLAFARIEAGPYSLFVSSPNGPKNKLEKVEMDVDGMLFLNDSEFC